MQWWEVQRYIYGLRRRDRLMSHWVRHLEWYLTCMFTDRTKNSPPDEPQDLYTFPWEVEHEDPKEQEEASRRLIQECQEYNARVEADRLANQS